MMGDTAVRRMFIGEDCGTMNRKNMRQEKGELRRCPAATDKGERGGIEGGHTGHG